MLQHQILKVLFDATRIAQVFMNLAVGFDPLRCRSQRPRPFWSAPRIPISRQRNMRSRNELIFGTVGIHNRFIDIPRASVTLVQRNGCRRLWNNQKPEQENSSSG